MLTSGVRPSLLLIEDHADTREILGLVLEGHGIRLSTARTTDEAIGRLEVEAFDLVLTDFRVDEVAHAEQWQRLAEVHRLARPSPVGMLTAFPMRAEEALDRGFAFVMAKPCATTELVDQIARTLALPPLSAARETTTLAYFAALERADYDGLVALCSDEVVYHLPRSLDARPESVVGRDALRALSQRTFQAFRSPHFAVDRVSPLPSGALVRYTGSWADPEGARHALPGHVLFEFVGDKIHEIGVRCDLASVG